MTLPAGVRGRLVPVDGALVRVLDTGSGRVPVVLEAGAMGTLDSFVLVREALGPGVRIIGYDRPGLGFSDHADARDRRPVASAARLARLLDVLGVHDPVVLCGHSLGGLYARAFASAHPSRVHALVLVDPSDERMLDTLAPAARWLATVQTSLMATSLQTLVVAGPLVRGIPRRLLGRLGLAEDELAALSVAYTSPASLRAMALELRQTEAACVEHATIVEATSVPLTVLSAGKGRVASDPPSAAAAMNELHAQLVARHDVGRHVVVADSGHLMPWDAPQVIAAEIRSAVSDAHDRIVG